MTADPRGDSNLSHLNEISELLRLHEQAIAQHPERTRAIFESGSSTLRTSLADATDIWPSYLNTAEIDTLTRYLLASSFIAAWYHLAGNRSKRDQAAQSCATLIGGLPGFDALEVLRRHMVIEREWRDMLGAEVVVPRPAFPVWSTLSLIIPALGYLRAVSAGEPKTAAIGYALSQLGYVLGAAGLLTGSFGIFGLRQRNQVWLAALVALGVGILLVNYRE